MDRSAKLRARGDTGLLLCSLKENCLQLYVEKKTFAVQQAELGAVVLVLEKPSQNAPCYIFP